jgi:hypothetical protein
MCPLGFLMLGSTCKTRPAIRPPHADQPAAEGKPRCAPAPTSERSSRASGLSWSATRSSWHCPTTSRRRRPGPNRRLGWPSSACTSFEHEAPTQADDEPGMDAAGDHADPGHPSHRAACPPPRSRTSLRPDTADAATHRHRTPTPDAGQRTADSGQRTLRRPHRTLDIGPVDRQAWTLVARTGHHTGHRTLAEDVDRVKGAAGIRTSWATTPSDRTLGRPTVFLWTGACGARQPMQARR